MTGTPMPPVKLVISMALSSVPCVAARSADRVVAEDQLGGEHPRRFGGDRRGHAARLRAPSDPLVGILY
ncbi:MAG: hypothetical protein ACC683_09905 [Acidimicrobiia bacterium]